MSEDIRDQGTEPDNEAMESGNGYREEHSNPEDIPVGAQYLIEAVLAKSIERVLYQLDQGVAANAEHEERNALCLASSRGLTDMVNLLLNKGAEVNQADKSDKMWFTQAIHKAAAEGHLPVVQALLCHGVSVNACDEEYRTPLHWAATRGQLGMARYLVQEGAVVNIVQMDGYTALHCATCLGHYEMCDYLLQEGAQINKADIDGWSVLHAACCYKHLHIIDLFLKNGSRIEQKAKDGETPLHIAVEGGNLDVAKKIVQAGAPIESETIRGNTALFESVWHSQYSVARYLMDMGANLNTRNSAGLSPLYVATLRVQDHFIHLLLDAGVDIQQEAWLKLGPLPILHPANRSSYTWLRDLIYNTRSLHDLCCVVLRRALRKPVSVHVNMLPLPLKLREKIELKHWPVLLADVTQHSQQT